VEEPVATVYKIHPAIGIARLGNSPESFPGPTIPGVLSPPAKYRDGSVQKRLKRQSVTFWVYAHDDTAPAAEPVRVKVGPNEAVRGIEWTVHVANKKAAWFKFRGLTGANDILNPPNFGYPPNSLRNPNGPRSQWVINPGPRTASAAGTTVEFRKGGSSGSFPETWPGPFQKGNAPGIDLLGAMRVEADFGLTVLGGFGNSGSVTNSDIINYANNPGWFDDACDGFVKARVVLADGSKKDAAAWVIVGPPDFAPPIENIVTLYDAVYDVGLRLCKLDPTVFDPGSKQFAPGFRPSFEEHIFPILFRASRYRWVYDNNDVPDPPDFHATFADLAALSQPPAGGNDPNLSQRRTVFRRLRNPNPGQPNNVPGNMPRLHSDLGDGGDGALKLTLTVTQFEMMRRWSEGQFTRGTGPLPPPPATRVTAAGLDRAALQAAVGGAFYPGIECGWIVREPKLYVDPFEFRFRVAADESDLTGLSPGDVTKRSACPWQADFNQCGNNWWPAQRPNQVRRSAASGDYVEWNFGVGDDLGMVQKWQDLGVVVKDPKADVYFEDERKMPRPP
jgi:hypothetical protein